MSKTNPYIKRSKNQLPSIILPDKISNLLSETRYGNWVVIDEYLLKSILDNSVIKEDKRNGQYLIKQLHSPQLENNNRHAIVFSFISPIYKHLLPSLGLKEDLTFDRKVNLALFHPKTDTGKNGINCVVLEGVKVLDLESINSEVQRAKVVEYDPYSQEP